MVRFKLAEALNDFVRSEGRGSGVGLKAMDGDRVAGLVWFIVRTN